MPSTAQPAPVDQVYSPSNGDFAERVLNGDLHAYVAFDWGDEIDLELAAKLVPAEVKDLPRRRRTPTSIGYRPLPLRLQLSSIPLELPELGAVTMHAEATVFDFGAVSVALRTSFSLSTACLSRLATSLADPSDFIKAAHSALEPLHQRLWSAIEDPLWKDDLSEEYFLFLIPPCDNVPPTAELLQFHADWLAGLVRLEAAPLSPEEIAEALRLHIRYSTDDLLVADWAAAVLLDRNCAETLQTIEFANLQLLEFRHIDNRLDDNLATAYRMIHVLAKSWLPFWRSHARSLRALGELKVEANGLFERTGNVFKLVGDQYLARVYRLLGARFHLEEWEQSILRKLEVAEGVYQVVSDQTSSYRTEFLEVVVVMLIFIEIVLALNRP